MTERLSTISKGISAGFSVQLGLSSPHQVASGNNQNNMHISYLFWGVLHFFCRLKDPPWCYFWIKRQRCLCLVICWTERFCISQSLNVFCTPLNKIYLTLMFCWHRKDLNGLLLIAHNILYLKESGWYFRYLKTFLNFVKTDYKQNLIIYFKWAPWLFFF